MKINLEIRKAQVGKGDKIYYFVAVVNGKGNVVTGASFADEDAADAAIIMLDKLLGYETYPCVNYDNLYMTVDIFFKKLDDGDNSPISEADEKKYYPDK